jgi:hypothetical protein
VNQEYELLEVLFLLLSAADIENLGLERAHVQGVVKDRAAANGNAVTQNRLPIGCGGWVMLNKVPVHAPEFDQWVADGLKHSDVALVSM